VRNDAASLPRSPSGGLVVRSRVYMYFQSTRGPMTNSSCVAIFLWCWHQTRSSRSLPASGDSRLEPAYAQCLLPQRQVLAVLAVEDLRHNLSAFRRPCQAGPSAVPAFLNSPPPLALAAVVLVACCPLSSRAISFTKRFRIRLCPRSGLDSGFAPAFTQTCSSESNSGMPCLDGTFFFSAIVGPSSFWLREPLVGAQLIAAFLDFYVFMAVTRLGGILSYGNRFRFLTTFFHFGLAVFVNRAAQLFSTRRAAIAAAASFSPSSLSGPLASSSMGFPSHSARGTISFPKWPTTIVRRSPPAPTDDLQRYLFKRRAPHAAEEDRDLQQLKNSRPPP